MPGMTVRRVRAVRGAAGREAKAAATAVRTREGTRSCCAVSTAGSRRAAEPARHCVKTPDHANIALKAMTSNSARLIVAVTKSHAPAKRKTKTSEVVRTRRFGSRCSRNGEVSSSAAKPSTIIPATLSCRSLSVLRGTHPTSARFTPITVRNSADAVAAPRRPARRPRRRRSRRTRTAKTTTSDPPTLSVVLKNAAERSPNVPSWLKCSCHHSGSLVVRIEARMPPTSTTSTSPARCMVGMSSTRRRTRRPRAGKKAEGTAGRTAMLISGTFVMDGSGVPPHRGTPSPRRLIRV